MRFSVLSPSRFACRCSIVSLASTAWLIGAVPGAPPTPGFARQVLNQDYLSDGINAADIDRDGHIDVVAGPYWYQGPQFSVRRAIYEPVPLAPEPIPSNSMFSYPCDFNGDGWPDVLVLGRHFYHEACWYENPGRDAVMHPDARWKKHFVAHRIAGESPAFTDIDGDGKPELLSFLGRSPDDKNKQLGWYSPDWSTPSAPWRFVPVTDKEEFPHNYHGQGVGDINGDGRLDIVLNEGWWEQPPAGVPAGTRWRKHPFRFSTDVGGAQILVYDVNGDGRNDVVTAKNAHGWGLSWFEQDRRGDDSIGFVERRIMGTRAEEAGFGVAFSQPHALALGDLDGDGLPDVVTGKRRWAHGPTGDIEPMATPVVYAFLLRRDLGAPGGARFVPSLVDAKSGIGVQVIVTDVSQDGVPDILTVSKLGTFVFRTSRPARN